MVLQLIRRRVNIMENNPLGVRKGTWTPEEDSLLRKCIEDYGEGKWHLVPLRAGLNRCRKSCRMRWFNYLKPNIKRGQFTEDEVDLIIRLHKLLGNRWTLIAGRLPGRTANDIKNFWNSHIDKKLPTIVGETTKENTQKTTTQCNIIRPRTRTFSNCQVPCRREKRGTTKPHIVWTSDGNPRNNHLYPSSQTDECIRWWSNLLETATENMANKKHQTVHCPQEILTGSFDDNEDNAVPEGQRDADGLCDFCVDIDVWELLSLPTDDIIHV